MSLVNFIIQGTLLGAGILILMLILLYWLRWIKDRCKRWRQREEINIEFRNDERENIEVKHIDTEVGSTDTDSIDASNSLLCRKAIYKHIHPECTTEEKAIEISKERSDYFKTYVNHVFQVHETEFELTNHDNDGEDELVIKSKRPCVYWECRRGRNNSEYMVLETGQMYAIFRPLPECHLLIRESKKTRIK